MSERRCYPKDLLLASFKQVPMPSGMLMDPVISREETVTPFAGTDLTDAENEVCKPQIPVIA